MANALVQVLVSDLIPLLDPLVKAAVSIGVVWAAAKFHALTGVQVDAAEQAKLLSILDTSIGHAEQWATAKAKVDMTAPLPSSAEKLDKALVWATGEMQKAGLDAKAKDELVKLLEARLGLLQIAT